jgi:hypothetical protein
MRDKDAHRISVGKPLEKRSWIFGRQDVGRTVHKQDNCAFWVITQRTVLMPYAG